MRSRALTLPGHPPLTTTSDAPAAHYVETQRHPSVPLVRRNSHPLPELHHIAHLAQLPPPLTFWKPYSSLRWTGPKRGDLYRNLPTEVGTSGHQQSPLSPHSPSTSRDGSRSPHPIRPHSEIRYPPQRIDIRLRPGGSLFLGITNYINGYT